MNEQQKKHGRVTELERRFMNEAQEAAEKGELTGAWRRLAGKLKKRHSDGASTDTATGIANMFVRILGLSDHQPKISFNAYDPLIFRTTDTGYEVGNTDCPVRKTTRPDVLHYKYMQSIIRLVQENNGLPVTNASVFYGINPVPQIDNNEEEYNHIDQDVSCDEIAGRINEAKDAVKHILSESDADLAEGFLIGLKEAIGDKESKLIYIEACKQYYSLTGSKILTPQEITEGKYLKKKLMLGVSETKMKDVLNQNRTRFLKEIKPLCPDLHRFLSENLHGWDRASGYDKAMQCQFSFK